MAFFALSGVAVGATVVSQKLIEQRLDSQIAQAKANGIDLEDLYYDFDLPGDAYPFGDAEGMDWVPKDWKPPKKGGEILTVYACWAKCRCATRCTSSRKSATPRAWTSRIFRFPSTCTKANSTPTRSAWWRCAKRLGK